MFLDIRLTPAADLNRLEEVLVITKVVDKTPEGMDLSGPIRASDILAERLPSVPRKPADDQAKSAEGETKPAGTQAQAPKPSGSPVVATPTGGTTPAAKPGNASVPKTSVPKDPSPKPTGDKPQGE